MGISKTEPSKHTVRFLVDPICPWAWKTALWMRMVARVRLISVEWAPFALSYLSRDQMDHPFRDSHLRSLPAFRLMAKAREMKGNEGLEKIYFTVAAAYHDEGRDLEDETMLAKALRDAGLSKDLLMEIREDTTLDKGLDDEYEHARSRGVFGVPSLFIDDDEVPYFGPVIDHITSEEEACELWDLILGLTRHDHFYELKRPRM